MSLLLVVIIGMIGRAVIMLGPGALAVSDSSITRSQAQRAAESGLEYASSKLRANPNWRGSDNRVTVDAPGLTVVEDHGNVIGLLSDSQGNVSQFRMRFNYQDGDPGADSLADPAQENEINMRYVSLNNLKGAKDIPIPLADEASFRVTKPDEGPHSLPKGEAYLIVEGRAGRGLNHVQGGNPNAPVQGQVSRYVAEAYLEVTLNDPNGQASMMGGGDIAFKVAKNGKVDVEVRGAAGNSDVLPRLRSKGSVIVDDHGTPGALHMVQGEVGRDENKPPGFSAAAQGGLTLTQESVGDGKDFFNLKWDAVTKAGSDPARGTAAKIPGGTYVHWDDGSVHYYDMALKDYETYMASASNQADAGVVLSPDLKEVRDPANLKATTGGLNVKGVRDPYTGNFSTTWLITKDLQVESSSQGVDSIAVIPRSGAAYSPTDQSDSIALSQPDRYSTQSISFIMKQSIVSANGDMAFFAQINGQDSTLTSGSNLKIITTKAEMITKTKGGGGGGNHGKGDTYFSNGLDVAQQLQLNMYAKKDISLSSYFQNDFKDLELEGLVYSWGNFTATLGDVAQDKWAPLELKGAVVAYGADPSSSNPGSAGTGRIDVTAKSADITWDERKLASLALLGSSTVNLRRSLYNHRE
ncbi:MAG: hypothetical protein U0931_02535 [Vulcanimicrobiota bacterium]